MKDKMISISDKVLTVIVVVLMMAGMLSIVVRMGTRILVKRGLCNEAFAKMIFFDNSNLAGIGVENQNTSQTTLEKIDWQVLYPFDGNTEKYYTDGNSLVSSKESSIQVPIIKRITKIFETWVNEEFICRKSFIETFMKIEKLFGINSFEGFLFSFKGTYELLNGHFTTLVSKRGDTSQKATALIKFNNFLKTLNTPFLYVQAPFKIDPNDKTISGKKDFSNQNTDAFLAIIQEAGIDFIDMRDEIKKAGLNHYDCFYKTDHHWKTETGLWATKIIAEILNEKFSLEIDDKIFDFENYNFEILHDSFLGSRGREVTLANTEMENFTLITPKKEYFLEAEFYSETNILRKATGGFDILLFPDWLQTRKTTYTGNAYAMYMDGDTIARIKNNSAENNLRILFLGDSFTDVVEPFFALGVKEFDTLDLRHFTGSLTSWFEQNGKYDAVVLMINTSATSGTIDYTTHQDLWDFR